MNHRIPEELRQVGLILNNPEWLQVRKIAFKQGLSGSELVRRFIREGLKRLQAAEKSAA